MTTRTQDSDVLVLDYTADLLGNIQQVLAGLQGYENMALELLQNADDAGATSIDFDVRNDRLIIRHDSKFSTCGMQESLCPWLKKGDPAGRRRPCDFHAVSNMAARGKVGQDTIGRFGIGFVSVFQVCDTPIIRSAGVELQLDPLTRKNARRFVDTDDGTVIELPWAPAGSETRTALTQSPNPPDVASKMVAALKSVSAEGLLFLRNLCEVRVLRSGNLQRHTGIVRQDGRIEVTTGAETVRWAVVEGDAAPEVATLVERYPTLGDLSRQTKVTVAFDLDGPVDREGLLYAFLPTAESSRLPCHINADFFPRQDRRTIVLTGEQHERYFNEALIRTAAKTIGENLDGLKEALGHERLWTYIQAASRLADHENPIFPLFWEAVETAASADELGYTSKGDWALVGDCIGAPAGGLTDVEEAAAEGIGLQIVHPDLRPKWNVLQQLGAAQLSLEIFVGALEDADDVLEADASIELLRGLWAIAERLIDPGRQSSEARIARLRTVPFVLDFEGRTVSLADLRKAPVFTSPEIVARYVPSFDFPVPALAEFSALSALIDVLTVVEFAEGLALALEDRDQGGSVWTSTPRPVFELLGSFDLTDQEREAVHDCLSDLPIIPAGGDLLPPSRARWPGGFVDPIGHFELVDAQALGPRGAAFVQNVLGVETLTFRDYLEEHLDSILDAGPTRDQHRALLREVLHHEAELSRQGDTGVLRTARLVRTTSGQFKAPSASYARTEEVEALLGRDADCWIDETWLPQERRNDCLALFRRLGMDDRVSDGALVERVETIVEGPPNPTNRALVNHIVSYLLERSGSFTTGREELSPLKELQWLPGRLKSGQDLERWYEPDEIQRPFRSEAFSSQLPYVDLPVFRGSRAAAEFLEFLGTPREPPTEAVVDHLIHCCTHGEPANDTIYAVLYERVRDDEPGDRAEVRRLREFACIFDRNSERYLSPGEVFWGRPPLQPFFAQASTSMAQREPLFRLLGVEDEPGPTHYAALLRTLVDENPTGLVGKSTDALVHGRCIEYLAQKVLEQDDDGIEALDGLVEEPFLLTLAQTFASPESVVWLDAPALAEPFGRDVMHILTAPPSDRSAAEALFRRLDVAPLSAVVRLQVVVADNPRADEIATNRLRERSDLILWLEPSPELHTRFSQTLTDLSIVRVDALSRRAEMAAENEPIVSAPQAVDAFCDVDSNRLFVAAQGDEPINWAGPVQALLTSVYAGAENRDLKHLRLAVGSVLRAASEEEARQQLEESGYEQPTFLKSEVSPEARLADLETESGDEGWQCPADETSIEGEPEDGDDEEEDEQDGQSNLGAEDAGHGSSGRRSSPSRGRGGSSANASERTDDDSEGGGTEQDPTRRGQSKPRAGRFLTYVAPESSGGGKGKPAAKAGGRNPVDVAAVKAVLAYEKREGRQPEQMSQTHPGYDIVSVDPVSGARRLIEVKGTEHEWAGLGVKLTKTQFANAQQYGDGYWLYVVEHALRLEKQKVYAVRNPFEKVEEFWFDHGWKAVIDLQAVGKELRFVEGERVRHATFGDGVVEKAIKVGATTHLTVNFGYQGTKSLPFNSDMTFLDD